MKPCQHKNILNHTIDKDQGSEAWLRAGLSLLKT